MPETEKNTRTARDELRGWYLQGLLPKLARAAGSGAVDPRVVEEFDGEMRAFLDLRRPRKAAA